ncbi:MAG: hypothetical protein JSS63_02155 [Bacteroidetes bacterium]|nr:hypothetical protein [Bacteroidota bacterium]
MRDSKLVEILKVFSAKEWKEFEKFVASPYFSSGRDVSGFYSILKKNYPDFTSESLIKENIFSSLFPKEKFNDKKLKNISSDLTKMAEQFLVHERLAADETLFEETLAKVYKDKKNDKLFLKTLNSLERKLSDNKFKSDTGFKQEEIMERLFEEYYIGIHKFDKSVPKRIKYTEYITLTFLVAFLRKRRDKIIIKNYYNLEFTSPLLESVFESIDFEKMLLLLKERKSEWYWLIEIYYYVLKTLENIDDEKMFEKFQNLFYASIDKFSRKEQYFMFNDFIAWIHEKDYTKGTVSTEQEFEIFKKMLEHSAYSPSENEFMSVLLYRNIMNMAISVQEFEWFKNFIDEYTDKLKPEFRENMANLASANLLFEQNNFEEALEKLSKIPYDVFIYKVDIKNLMLRIYYELDLYEAGFSMVNAFRNFLSVSDEISETFKIQHLNFVNFYNRLLKMKSESSNQDAGFLQSEISKKDSVASKGWLIDKTKELALQMK